jgi:hypothetical protein
MRWSSEESARVAEDRDQQEQADLRAADDHALLAEVDLQLRARRRFDAHRRDVGRPLRLPHRRHGSLDGAQPYDLATLAEQPMWIWFTLAWRRLH